MWFFVPTGFYCTEISTSPILSNTCARGAEGVRGSLKETAMILGCVRAQTLK